MKRHTRREFLKDAGSLLALGGATTLLGCSGPREYTAEFVGQSFERGHRLRDLKALPAPDETRSVGVAIVGGGIAGLAAARALARAGIDDYRIFELEDEAGGNSRAGAYGGLECPWGAHYLPVPDDRDEDLLELLTEWQLRDASGRYDERHLCHAPAERLFMDGLWHEGILPFAGQPTATLDQYTRFSKEIDALLASRQFTIPTHRAPWNAQLAALDAQTFAQWLDARGYTAPPLRWFLDYCCRDDYGAGAASVSAWAGLHYFASRHGFEDPRAPRETDSGVLTWPEGNAFLARRLASPHAQHIETGAIALRIEETRGDVAVDVMNAASGKLTRWRARRVMVATPLHVAARLLVNPSAALATAAQAVPHAPWLVANLQIDKALVEKHRQAPPSWDNVVYDGAGLGYVDAGHQAMLPYRGATVLTYYLALGNNPAAGRKLLLERDLATWCRAILADLATAQPDLRDKLVHIGIMRYGHAMSIPAPGARSSPALAALRESKGRVHFAHADLASYSIFEEAFAAGLAAGRAAGSSLRG